MKQFLNPEWFKVESARILIANGLESKSLPALQKEVASEFKKLYPIGVIKVCVNELIEMQLMERDGNMVRVTGMGLELVIELRRLSRTKPNPWRKYTRESYSPNYGIESRLGEAPTTGGVPVCADARTW